MLSVTHPSKVEQLQSQWQADVTGAINNVEKIIAELLSTIPLSDLAASIGVWISTNSKWRRGELVEYATLRAEFGNVQETEIDDAMANWNSPAFFKLNPCSATGSYSSSNRHSLRGFRPTLLLKELIQDRMPPKPRMSSCPEGDRQCPLWRSECGNLYDYQKVSIDDLN